MEKLYLTLGLILIAIACSKEDLEVQEPVWGYQSSIFGDTLYAASILVSGTADSTRCLFFINDMLKQEGESGFFKCALVKSDSLLIYKSIAYLGDWMWVNWDTVRFSFSPIEKIPVDVRQKSINIIQSISTF